MKKKKRRRRGFFSLSFSSFFLSLSISLSLFFFVLTRRKTGYRLSAFIGQLDRTTNFIGSEVSVSSFPFFFFFRNCFFPRFTSFLFLSINIYSRRNCNIDFECSGLLFHRTPRQSNFTWLSHYRIYFSDLFFNI